jgi:Flp pilus assembly protein TadG
MSAFFTAITRLFRDKSGNVAVIFAIVCIPVVSVVGCAVDYLMATRMRAKLQSAADAASVAAVSMKSPGYNQAAAMIGNGTVSAGITDADNVFDGNMSPIPTTSYGNLTRTSLVTKTGVQLTSTVQFSAQVPVTFMKVLGYQNLSISGTSSSSDSLPPYLDFYLALDVSGSMGLPSTATEAQRMQSASPDDYVDYPTGCTLACHFAPQNSACVNPTNPPKTNQGQSGFPTNGYCLGYMISRVSPSGFNNLLQAQSPAGTYPYINLNQKFPSTLGKSQQLPPAIVAGLPNSLYAALPPVSSCPTAGTDNCIQLRLDAVGFALNAKQSVDGMSGLLELAQKKETATGVPDEFRIGLYPFITDIDASYAPLTASINGSSSTPGTINYAAKNLATELVTNMNSNLGSGGTHIDNSLNSINNVIASVGDGSSSTNTQPYVFLVTDGAQDNQYKDVPNGSWHSSNWATVLNDSANNTYSNICQKLKNRGIIVSVLYIPYQTISPVNTSFANDEDDHANWNIPNITNPSGTSGLQTCASPPDAGGGSYFYTANTPADIQASLNAMFNHPLQTARITN